MAFPCSKRRRRVHVCVSAGDDDVVRVYLGLYPLVVAQGASELARRGVGTPVFGGMILASFVGIFAIPPLYVMFQAIRERLRPGARPKDTACDR